MTVGPGHWNPAQPASVYERWVRALKAWVTDPSVRLEDLPPLTEETYDPQTYSRLFAHMRGCIDELMDAWSDLLTRALSRATDEHELGRELVNLRPLLARRAALSRLPNLPEEVRKILHEDTVRSITELQSELEKVLGDPGQGARIDRAAADRLVAVARATPLTEALTMTTTHRSPSGAAALTAEHPPLLAPGPGTSPVQRRSRWSHRVIGTDPTPSTGEPHA